MIVHQRVLLVERCTGGGEGGGMSSFDDEISLQTRTSSFGTDKGVIPA